MRLLDKTVIEIESFRDRAFIRFLGFNKIKINKSQFDKFCQQICFYGSTSENYFILWSLRGQICL